MSRTLPSQCPHGAIYDWGDFGCCPNESPEECEPCGQKATDHTCPTDDCTCIACIDEPTALSEPDPNQLDILDVLEDRA